MDLGLQGKLAIVTGGSRGLGRAIALELAHEGADVAICSRNQGELDSVADEIRATGVSAFAMKTDVTVAEEIGRFVAAAADALGGVDILVNNAGGARPGRFGDFTDHDWSIDLDVKLYSIIRCTRAVLPHMRSRGGGRVINIGAVQGKAPDALFCGTSTIRAAGNNLTKVLAQEYGPEGVLVNAVNIGKVTTPQWDNIRERTAPELSMSEYTSREASDIPLGRWGRDDEVAGIVAFLAGERSSYMTGNLIDVAGGVGQYA